MNNLNYLIGIGFKPNGTLALEELKNLEHNLNFRMPEDYKSFLLLTNGGILSNEVSYYFETKSLSEPIELTVFLGNKQENRIYDLGYWYSQCHYEYHNLNIALIALADPGEIMLVNEPGKEGVYLWDDSLELETSTEDNCMYKIADSFEEFVSKIYVEEI